MGPAKSLPVFSLRHRLQGHLKHVDPGYVAGVAAMGLSICAIVACALAVPILFSRLGHMKGKVSREVRQFKMSSNDIWVQMMEISKELRAKRQSSYDRSLTNGGFAGNLPPGFIPFPFQNFGEANVGRGDGGSQGFGPPLPGSQSFGQGALYGQGGGGQVIPLGPVPSGPYGPSGPGSNLPLPGPVPNPGYGQGPLQPNLPLPGPVPNPGYGQGPLQPNLRLPGPVPNPDYGQGPLQPNLRLPGPVPNPGYGQGPLRPTQPPYFPTYVPRTPGGYGTPVPTPIPGYGTPGPPIQECQGPPGPPGINGYDGMDGFPGEDGLPGKDGNFVPDVDEGGCQLCPAGPPGRPGPIGLGGQALPQETVNKTLILARLELPARQVETETQASQAVPAKTPLEEKEKEVQGASLVRQVHLVNLAGRASASRDSPIQVRLDHREGQVQEVAPGVSVTWVLLDRSESLAAMENTVRARNDADCRDRNRAPIKEASSLSLSRFPNRNQPMCTRDVARNRRRPSSTRIKEAAFLSISLSTHKCITFLLCISCFHE